MWMSSYFVCLSLIRELSLSLFHVLQLIAFSLLWWGLSLSLSLFYTITNYYKFFLQKQKSPQTFKGYTVYRLVPGHIAD